MIANTLRAGLRRYAALACVLLLPLALGLAACGKKGNDTGAAVTPGAPVAKVAPPAGKAWSDVVTITADGGYRMGNPNAAIKVAEYGSLTCPHCAEFNKESEDVLRDTFVNSGRVSFEFHNFVRDPIDITASMLVRCGAPENFFALTHEVYGSQMQFFDKVKAAGDDAYQQAIQQPPAQRYGALARLTGLDAFFAERGLPKAKIAQCLANSATADTLAKATEDVGQKYDVDSTPTFFFNGEKGPPATWPDVKARIEAMGAR